MNTKNLLGFGLVAILAILTVSNPFTSTYVHQLKNEAVQTSSSENKLLKSIEAAAKNMTYRRKMRKSTEYGRRCRGITEYKLILMRPIKR